MKMTRNVLEDVYAPVPITSPPHHAILRPMADHSKHSNYFNVSRDLLKHELWLKEPFTRAQAWIDLIGRAHWKPAVLKLATYKLITLRRGQLVASQFGLAERWKWSRSKVRRFLNGLVAEGMIATKKWTPKHLPEPENGLSSEDQEGYLEELTSCDQTGHRLDFDAACRNASRITNITIITIVNYDKFQS